MTILKITILLISSLASFYLIYPRTLISVENDILIMSDFAHYITRISAFWFNGKINLYDFNSHEAINSSLAGMKVNGAMPLGITPIAAFVFLPFALISKWNITAAQIVWMCLSLFLFCDEIAIALKEDWNKNSSWSKKLILGILIIVALSSTMSHSIALGQTSIFAAALLLHLIRGSNQINQIKSTILILVCLGIKPTYFIFAALILAAQNRIKELIAGSLGCLVLIGLFSTYANGSWLSQYFESIYALSSTVSLKGYQPAFSLGTSNIFRNLLLSFYSAPDALKTAQRVFYSGLLFLGALGLIILTRKIRYIEKQSLLLTLSFTTIFFYFLFAPYIGAYEDIIIIGIIISSIKFYDLPVFTAKSLLLFPLILISAFISYNFDAFGNNNPTLLWTSKLVFLLSLLYSLNASSAYKDT